MPRHSTVKNVPVLLVCLLSACAYQPISPTADGISGAVSVGDTVRVTTRDGQRQTFVVTSVDAAAVRGEGSAIPYAQIAQMERREINRPVVWTLVAVGAVAAAAGGGSGSY